MLRLKGVTGASSSEHLERSKTFRTSLLYVQAQRKVGRRGTSGPVEKRAGSTPK